MKHPTKQRGFILTQELLVPAIMLLCAGFYWLDAKDISADAQAFPLTLTAVLFLLLASIVGRAVWEFYRTKGQQQDTVEGRPVNSRVIEFKRWAVVLFPIILIFFWRQIGAAPAIFFNALFVLYILGERRPSWLIIIPSFLAVALTYLFKTVLYLRLPDSPWIPGNWL